MMIEEIDLERPPPPDSEDQGPITSQNYIDCFQKKKKSQLQVSEMKPSDWLRSFGYFRLKNYYWVIKYYWVVVRRSYTLIQGP